MIYIPKICSVCYGAGRAIDLAYSLKDKDKKVVIYKEILHNERIIDDLKNNGINCVDSLDNIDKDTIVVIRAHGEPKSTYEFLDSKNIEYCDATCPNVIKIHDIICDRYSRGYSIIIIGQKKHPEVIGSNGWCSNNAFIVEDELGIENINKLNDKVLVIAQTTISKELFKSVSSKIKEKFSNLDIECVDTVCLAQKKIQDSSVEQAKKCEYTFVIGGKKSANVRELYNKCSEVSKSYLFSDIKEFYEHLISNKSLNINTDICITGGASTPMLEILDFKNLLEFYLNYKNIKESLANKMKSINSSFALENDNSIVLDAVNKLSSINCDGKYIRAFLIELGYMLSGKTKDYADMLALGYETFETSILVHDDIIDKASLRRGKDTIPVSYKKQFKDVKDVKSSKVASAEVANALALCIGNLGYYFANQIIVKEYGSDKNLSSILEYYNKIVINTIKGEIIDVYLPFKEQYLDNATVKEEDILEIFKLKTSWYTIVGPFCLGMILSGANSDEVKLMEEALLPIGIAFQIKDDLLDVFSSKADILKDSSDISEFKQTLLYYYTVNDDSYKDKLLKYYGKKKLSSKDISEVRKIFEDSGARKYAEDMMNKFFKTGKNKLEKVNIPIKYKNILSGFIAYLELRNK